MEAHVGYQSHFILFLNYFFLYFIFKIQSPLLKTPYLIINNIFDILVISKLLFLSLYTELSIFNLHLIEYTFYFFTCLCKGTKNTYFELN